MLNFTCKLVPDGAGYDDGDDNGGLAPVVGSARKKRKAYEELQEASKKTHGGLEGSYQVSDGVH